MDTVLASYPDFSKLDKVLYDSGLAENKMGHEDEARQLWERPRGTSVEPLRQEGAADGGSASGPPAKAAGGEPRAERPGLTQAPPAD